MEIFGIGILELLFIAVIMLIVLGPGQLEKTLRTLGRWIAQFRRSTLYQDITQTEKLKRTIMQETGLELVEQDFNNLKNWRQQLTDLDQSIGGRPPQTAIPPSQVSAEIPAAPGKSAPSSAPQYKGWVTPVGRPSAQPTEASSTPVETEPAPASTAGFAGWKQTTPEESTHPPAA